MAEGSSNSAQSEENDSEFLTGYKDVGSFAQSALRATMAAIKASNQLPSAGDDFDYYSSFGAFRELMGMEGRRLLQMMQGLLRYHGIKGNVASGREGLETEERFDTLVDTNDQLLERIGMYLDEAAGLRKDESPLVVASVTPKGPLSGSWNRKSFKSHSGKFRLLAAHGIQRPQLKFKDKIDNSPAPFIPKIKHKPNALKPLPESILEAQSDNKVHQRMDTTYSGMELEDFPHPYEYELEQLTYPDSQLQTRTPQVPTPLESIEVIMVTEVGELMELCDTLREVKEFAVDLEHHSYRTYQGITCLMQLSTRSQDYIVDVLSLRSEAHVLNEVFTDPAIVKVFHGADHDIEWLQRDLGIYVVNMFDTGQAARVLNLARHSLAHLLWEYCKVVADKQYQLADWRMRPLPDELVRYAREDTHHLLYIYDRLHTELLERGNNQSNLLRAVLQRSNDICKKRYRKQPYGEEAALSLYRNSKKAFNARQLAALKGLHEWRDNTAREGDESLGYTLPNHMLLQIADVMPRDSQGVLACCNPIPSLVRQNINQIQEIISKAKQTPLTKVEASPRPQLPSIKHHPKYSTQSLFSCPHDLSHQHQDTRKSANNLDMSLVANASSFLPENHRLTDKTSGGRLARTAAVDSALSSAAQRALTIRTSLASPFEKYLSRPASSKTHIRPPVFSATEKPPWRLLPSTPKPSAAQTSAAVKEERPSAPAANTEVEVEESGLIPLRQMWPKTGNKRKADNADSVDSSSGGKQIKVKKEPTLAVVEADFKPHDYKPQLQSQSGEAAGSEEVAKKKKKKKKDYNPDNLVQDDMKNPSKPRLQPASGKKSQTFGATKVKPKIMWPK